MTTPENLYVIHGFHTAQEEERASLQERLGSAEEVKEALEALSHYTPSEEAIVIYSDPEDLREAARGALEAFKEGKELEVTHGRWRLEVLPPL